MKKYLSTLQSRQRWLTAKRTFEMGDVVLATTKTTNQGQWHFEMINGCQVGLDDRLEQLISEQLMASSLEARETLLIERSGLVGGSEARGCAGALL